MFVTSCKKKYDQPPTHEIPESSRLTVAGVKASLTGTTMVSYKFTNDVNLYCTVIADEIGGNFYKTSYVRDASGAICLRLNSSGGLYIGDSLRINLNGAVLVKSSGNFELDSIDVDKMVVKQKSGLNPQPIVTTLANLNLNTASTSSLVGQLVQITNVEFATADQNVTYAYPATQASANRALKSCSGSTITVYTSGYSNFAGQLTPSGNGSVIGIMSLYSGKTELTLRKHTEVNLTGPLCSSSSTSSTTYISKNFDDNSLITGGWDTVMVIGTLKWSTSTFSTTPTPFAKVSGYSAGNKNTEIWLISPAIDLSAATNPNLYFKTAAATFAGNPLEIVVSTNYTSGMPSSATWVNLSAALSPTTTSYAWTPSGTVSLSAYKTANTRIAFKYTSTTAAAATYELDDIIVQEN